MTLDLRHWSAKPKVTWWVPLTQKALVTGSLPPLMPARRSRGAPELLGDLAQQASPSRRTNAPLGELRELSLQLRPNKEAIKLLGGHRRGPRSAERIEDELAFPRRG